MSCRRYEFSLPPRILSGEGQWSLLDPFSKGDVTSTTMSQRPKTKGNTAIVFAATDSAKWLSGRDYANGMRIPFYSSSASNYKEGQNGVLATTNTMDFIGLNGWKWVTRMKNVDRRRT